MKKVLIVTYYWPPAGGPGVQRIVNMVRHLPDMGWEPVILTVESPSAPVQDKSLVNMIPSNCRVYKTKTFEPFSFYKKFTGKSHKESIPKNVSEKKGFKETLARFVRANFFIPDARRGWIPYLVQNGIKIIEKEKPDIIFSSSPPHSLQVGVRRLAKKSACPWIADFRDPWSEAYWERAMPKTGLARKLNSRYEKLILATADKISTVSPGTASLFGRKAGRSADIIYNGYRDVDVPHIGTDKFEIIHVGNLSRMQSCRELIDVLGSLPSEIREKMKLVFIGHVDASHRAYCREKKVIRTEYRDFMPYHEMMHVCGRASLLYLPRLNVDYAGRVMTAKIFDYLRIGKPVLAYGDKNSDIEQLLDKSGSGRLFTLNDMDGAKRYLRDIYAIWEQRGETSLPAGRNLEEFSMKANVKKLADILEEMT